MGALTADFPAGSDPDLTDPLQVQLIGANELDYLVMLPQNAAVCFFRPWRYLGGVARRERSFEIVCPTAVTQTGPTTLSASAIHPPRRGRHADPGSSRRRGVCLYQHRADAGARAEYQFAGGADRPSWLGKTLHFKFPAFNLLRAQQQDLSECADYTYSLTGKVMTGINGQYAFTEIAVYLGQMGSR